MYLHAILQTKGEDIQTTSPQATLSDVIDRLVSHNIGSLLVCETLPHGLERLVGIITERDILRSHAYGRGSLDETQVRHVMSSQLVTASPHDTTATAMRLMTTHFVRHLPLVDDGAVCGIVSIGDIVKAHHDELELENHCMKAYIQGESADLRVSIV